MRRTAAGRTAAGRMLAALLPDSPGARWTLAVVAVIVLVNAGLALGGALQPRPSGPSNSSFATQPGGFAAWASLLGRNGHDVQRRRDDLDDGRLDARATLVVLDPERVRGEDVRAMRRFLARGGRLVAGGRFPGWLDGVLTDAPRWSPDGVRRARAVPGADLEPAVSIVRSAGAGAWAEAGAARALVGRPRSLVLEARESGGRALLLADASPLQNRLLGQADNAALALALAGPEGRRVIFAESLQGFGEQTGVGAIPSRWRIALGGLLLAGLLWLASRARRLGPAEPVAPDPHPARREHVTALAQALAKGAERAAVAEPLREAARRRIAARAGLGPRATDAELRAAAVGLGWTEEEAAALTAAAEAKIGDDELLATGRALARTYEERR